MKLNVPITVADGKTLTLLVAGDAEHTVNDGISLGNGSNVIIEGDLTKENNKLTVTATGSKAGIGADKAHQKAVAHPRLHSCPHSHWAYHRVGDVN